jgi:DNA polymerase IV
MNRSILHIDLDTFFVSCVRLQNSTLLNKPVIVGGARERGVVASCSYEARTYGVRSAMPMRYALQLCPQAIVVKGDMDFFSRKSQEVSTILEDQSPLMERASIDEFYIDVTGLDRFFGTWKWSNELSKKISRETGLPLSLGLSVNKTVSKIATGEAKPSGKKEVAAPQVTSFLNPLSIRKIPMVGEQTYQVLARIGVKKIQTLAEMPPEMMKTLLGKNGITLWKKAHGIDNTPVVRYNEQKSISSEHTFHKDTMDIPMLHALIISMVEKLAFRLRKSNKLCSILEVKIRYANFHTETRQTRIPYTSCDHVLIPEAASLFNKLYSRRMLLRLVGVKLSGLVQGHYQIDLFEDTGEMISLYQAIDRMKRRFGESALYRGGSLETYAR